NNHESRDSADILADTNVPLDTVKLYAQGVNPKLTCVALAALARRHDGSQALPEVLAHLGKFSQGWAIYFALEFFLTVTPSPAVGVAVLHAREWWLQHPILALIFRDYLARSARRGAAPTFETGIYWPSGSQPEAVRTFLGSIDHPFAAQLLDQLTDVQRRDPDRSFLRTVGRLWADLTDSEILISPDDWQPALATAAAQFMDQGSRPSLLVSGAPLVGKTSFLRLLAQRVASAGWSVFEASGLDIQAGQIYV